LSTRPAGDKARPPAAAPGRPERALPPSDGGPSAIDEPLLSPNWFRVADLRLQLRPGVQVAVHRTRGQTWTLLTDPVSGRHHRFNAAAQSLLRGCDGQRTLEALWSACLAEAGDDAPTQGETIRLMAQAFSANLLVGDIPPDAQALIHRQRQTRRRRRARLNPLAWRVGLWNPDALLERIAPAFGWLLAPLTRWVIGLLALLSLVGLLVQADALAQALGAQISAGEGRLLLLMWLAYPPIKALHEAAHALLTKLHGGRVSEVGVALLFLNPVPYVDASASAAFPRRGQRMAVAAAGIVVELLIAGAALAAWLALEPGLARDAALAVVGVAGLSTLLVNGNPLLRFDGYHVLCDAAELPNLALRSTRWWADVARRRLLWLGLPPMPVAPGERPWLVAYAPLSWLARLALSVALAAALAAWSAALGLLVLAYGLWGLLGQPLVAVLRWLARSPEAEGQRARTLALAATAATAVLAAVVAVPLPDRTSAPAVVWLPDDALVRLETEGQLQLLHKRDGEPVAAGEVIAQLDNPPLLLELQQARSALAQQRVERALKFELSAGALAVADDEIARLGAQVARLEQRVAALSVRARIAGRLVLDTARVRPGQHLGQGDLIAQVLPGGAPLVRALVRQEDADLVRQAAPEARVELAHADGGLLPARLLLAAPSGTLQLPSPALGEAAGGAVPLDPADQQGLTAREPRFQVDLALAEGTPAHVGARARVVFDHGQASLASLAWRGLRQAFLRHFER